jgi:hypothetical protein
VPDRPEGLHDDETLIDTLAVRFSTGIQSTLDEKPVNTLYRPPVTQRRSYLRWVRNANRAGFPVAGPEMVLGVSNERLLVWRTALIRARPKSFAGAVPLSSIQSAGVHRRVLSTVLTLLMEGGTIVTVETLHGRHLRAFAAAIPTFTDFRGL